MRLMKYLTIVFLIAMQACRQTDGTTIEGLTIDPMIKDEAEKHFHPLNGFDTTRQSRPFYQNAVALEYFENGSLVASTKGLFVPQPFNSSYVMKGDTVLIYGFIGLFAGGTGFAMEIIENKATVYNLVIADDFPAYAYGENTELLQQLHVPCEEFRAVISAIPTEGNDEMIYGFVEFKGSNYYFEEGDNKGPVSLRKKLRANMKMYFKSQLRPF